MARRSVANQVAASIVDYIRANRMISGDHLAAQVLAEACQVSRAPVNVALKALNSQGVVTFEPNRGFFLALNWHELEDQREKSSEPEISDDPVYLRLAEDRLSGMLPEKISENELMRMYALPRGRLTKILYMIADEGWVERLPGNGWRFTEVLTSQKHYQESYAFRAAIEREALLLPTFSANLKAIADLRATQEQLRSHGYMEWSAARIFAENNKFHETIIGFAGNQFFLDALRRVNRLRRLIEYRLSPDRSRLPQQAEEHLHLLDLIEQGRIREAAAFSYKHILGASKIKVALASGG